MASIFTRIIKGEIPCYKVAESELFFAFLDISPLSEGHTLVVPKQEIDYIFDLDDETYIGLMAFAKKVGMAIEKACQCERIGLSVIGLEVPHAHIHLVPINSIHDLDFSKARKRFSSEEMAEIAKKIATFM